MQSLAMQSFKSSGYIETHLKASDSVICVSCGCDISSGTSHLQKSLTKVNSALSV